MILNSSEDQITVTIFALGLSGFSTGGEIQGPSGTVFSLPSGNFTQTFSMTPSQVADLRAGLWFINLRTSAFPSGEIRGSVRAFATEPGIGFPFSNGLLDSTFNSGGTVTTPIGTGNDVAQAVAVQPDGKIVVAGFASNGTNNDFAIVRYRPDGTLDDTFDGSTNANGRILTSVGASEDEPFAIALQPDGKILIAGQSLVGATADASIVRYNPDGTLDTSFEMDGRVITPVGPGDDVIRSLAVQADGKIVAAGTAWNGTNNDVLLLRYESNGMPDASFDGASGTGNGIVTIGVGPGNDLGFGVAIQPDGKLVVAGYYFNGSNIDAVTMRFNALGVLDPTFNGDGIVTSSGGPGTDESLSLALQPDGKIVTAGCSNSGAGNDFFLTRYTASGDHDPTFSSDGVVVVPIGAAFDIAFAVSVQTDGKIVAAGFSNNGANNDFALVRVNVDGSLDTTFDNDGRVTTPINLSADSANDVALQPDGKIIAVGRTVVGSTADFGVARYGYGTNATGNNGFYFIGTATAARFDNAVGPGTTSATRVPLHSLPPLPAGMRPLNDPRQIDTTVNFNGEIVVGFTLSSMVDQSHFDSASVLRIVAGQWIDATATTPQREFSVRSIYARSPSPGIFVVVTPLASASSSISITGRLVTSDMRAARKSIVSLMPVSGGTLHTVSTPSGGYFRFQNVSPGTAARLIVGGKRQSFAPVLISSVEDVPNLVLTTVQ